MKNFDQDIRWMLRCLELASKGKHGVGTNPMVGSVIVYNNTIIGEGFHYEYGKAHAEVNAIQNVKDKSLLKDSTIYVSLEPCAHFGKTPPCSDLIIKHKLKRVVIATIDPFSEVSGKGIDKLEKAGIKTDVGVLQEKARLLNRKFFVNHQYKRPYIILKWAESKDGFLDKIRTEDEKGSYPISQPESAYYNHLWRTEEDSILIGYNTALTDNPKLTNRKMYGDNPLRIVLDYKNALPKDLNLFSDKNKTWQFLSSKITISPDNSIISLNTYDKDSFQTLLDELFKQNIQSVIVEGGLKTHETFIEKGLWDEIRIIKGEKPIHKGLESVKTSQFDHIYQFKYLNDEIRCIINPNLKL